MNCPKDNEPVHHTGWATVQMYDTIGSSSSVVTYPTWRVALPLNLGCLPVSTNPKGNRARGLRGGGGGGGRIQGERRKGLQDH